MQIMIPNLCEDFEEREELDFYRILFQLGKLDCSYMSYSLERPDGKRINFFSDKEWLNVYNSQGFMKVCQLAMLCRHNRNTIIKSSKRDLPVPSSHTPALSEKAGWEKNLIGSGEPV